MRSCDASIFKIANNDASLTSLTILPMKIFASSSLTSLARALKSNTKLTALSASGHSVSAEALGDLSEALCSVITPNGGFVKALAIGDASSMDDAGLIALCEHLGTASTLTALDLSSKSFSTSGFVALAAAIAGSDSTLRLKRLNLSRNEKINDEALEAFIATLLVGGGEGEEKRKQSLQFSSKLKYLDLSECSLSNSGVISLVS
jgi:hypothetical protein